MKKIILFIIFVFIVSGLWSDLTNDCLTTQLKKELLKKDEVEFIRINIRLEKQYNTTQLIEDAAVDQLLLRRLKKRRLHLKDQIKHLESELIPDLDA